MLIRLSSHLSKLVNFDRDSAMSISAVWSTRYVHWLAGGGELVETHVKVETGKEARVGIVNFVVFSQKPDRQTIL